jgi:hypothetical protein
VTVSGQYGCLAAQVAGEIGDDRAHGGWGIPRRAVSCPGKRPDTAFELPDAVLRKQAGCMLAELSLA